MARPTASFVGTSYFSPKYPCSIEVIIFAYKGLTSLALSAFCGAFRRDLRSAVLRPEYFSLVIAGHLRYLVSSLSSYGRTWAMPASSLSSSSLRKGLNSKTNSSVLMMLLFIIFQTIKPIYYQDLYRILPLYKKEVNIVSNIVILQTAIKYTQHSKTSHSTLQL